MAEPQEQQPASFDVFLDEFHKAKARRAAAKGPVGSAARLDDEAAQRVLAALRSGRPESLEDVRRASGLGIFAFTPALRVLVDKGLAVLVDDATVRLTPQGQRVLQEG